MIKRYYKHIFVAFWMILVGISISFCKKQNDDDQQHHDQNPGSANITTDTSKVITATVSQPSDTILTFTNTGDAKAHVLSFYLDKDTFKITSNQCENIDLFPKASCDLVIQYKPITVESSKLTITVTYQDPKSQPTSSIQFSFQYSSSDNSGDTKLVFDSPIQPIAGSKGQTPLPTETITIKNTNANIPVVISQITSFKAPLKITEDNCSKAILNSAHETCTIIISLDTSDVVNSSQGLNVPYTAGTTGKNLSGTVQYRVSAPNPQAQLTVGNVKPMIKYNDGNFIIQNIEIKNTGSGSTGIQTVDWGEKDKFFVQAHNTCMAGKQIPQGSSCILSFALDSATPTKPSMNHVTINYAGKTLSFDIPYAILIPVSDTSPVAVFGGMPKLIVNSTTQSYPITITNQSTGSVQLNSFLPLSSDSVLSISNNQCTNKRLPAGNQCTFILTYTPNGKQIWLSSELIGITYGDSATSSPQSAITQSVTFSTDTANMPDPLSLPSDDFVVVNNCPLDPSITGDTYLHEMWNDAQNGYQKQDTLIQSKTAKGFPIDDGGKASIKINAMLGCKDQTNCLIGTPAAPSINTLFEATWGCTESDQTKCNKNPAKPSDPITKATFLDISMVDGYTIPMSMIVLPAENETNAQCFGTSTPFEIDYKGYTNCPTDETINNDPKQWSINFDSKEWGYDYIQNLITNHVQDSMWGKAKDFPTLITQNFSQIEWNTLISDIRNNKSITSPTKDDGQLQCKIIDNKGHEQSQTINLKNVSLVITAPTSTTKVGCAGAGKISSISRAWGGLGLGSECTDQTKRWCSDPFTGCSGQKDSTIDVSIAYNYIDFLDPRLFYENPYGLGHLSNPNVVDFTPTLMCNPNSCIGADSGDTYCKGAASYDPKQGYTCDNDLKHCTDNKSPDTCTNAKLACGEGNSICQFCDSTNPPSATNRTCRGGKNDPQTTWGTKWQAISDFCKNQSHSKFCNDPTVNGPALLGRMGPVGRTKWVQAIKKYSDEIYTWQYDDAAGTRVCDRRPKVILTFCPTNGYIQPSQAKLYTSRK